MTYSAAQVIDHFKDQRWRLNNLYWITDKEGRRVRFQTNWAQERLLNEMNYLDGLRPARIPEKTEKSTALAASNLTGAEQVVYGCFAGGALVSLDAISGLTHLPTAELSATLMMLELKRLIVKRADGTFEAR